MKKIIKTKMNLTKKAKIELFQPNSSLINHLRLIKSRHAGKLVHHRHTSHLSLVILLIFIGIFMYFYGYFSNTESFAISDQSSVLVTATVPGEITSSNTNQGDLNKITETVANPVTWFEAPVPMYILVFVLTLGFWIGDLFDREFGLGKTQKR